MTSEEIGAVESAIAAARDEVDRLDRAAAVTDGPFSWLFPSAERRAANTARDVLAAIVRVRNGVVESPDFDHDTALKIIQMAREVATPGWTAHALENATVGEAVASGEAFDAAKRAVGAAIPWWVWALLALVVLVALTPTLTALAAFRRRV